MPISYSFRDLSVHPVRQTGMAKSTRLVILIKNIYTLWGRKRFLPPVTFFPNLSESKNPVSEEKMFKNDLLSLGLGTKI